MKAVPALVLRGETVDAGPSMRGVFSFGARYRLGENIPRMLDPAPTVVPGSGPRGHWRRAESFGAAFREGFGASSCGNVGASRSWKFGESGVVTTRQECFPHIARSALFVATTMTARTRLPPIRAVDAPYSTTQSRSSSAPGGFRHARKRD